jgi:hypothetical protein
MCRRAAPPCAATQRNVYLPATLRIAALRHAPLRSAAHRNVLMRTAPMFEPKVGSTITLEVRIVVDLLLAVPIGEIVTYKQMTTAISRPIQSCRHVLQRALSIAHNENGSLWACIHRQGYRRMAAEDAPLVGDRFRRRTRKAGRRASRQIAAALEHSNDVSAGARRKAYAEISTAGLLVYLAADRHVRHVVASHASPVPVAVVLKDTLDRLMK